MTEEENDETNGKQYVKIMAQNLKMLEESKPEDRLGFVKGLIRSIQILNISMKGWASWLGNFDILDKLTLEEMQEIYPKMKQLVIDFVNMDIEITNKKFNEEEKKHPPKEKPKKLYVA